MKKNLLKTVLIFCMGLVAFAVNAQEQEEPESAAELAKELANPNTTLGTMAFPIDFIMYNGDLPDANKQSSVLLNFQPSLPIPLSKGVNLFVRPLVPIYLSQPVMEAGGFEQKGINLGNISADIAVGKTWKSNTITILGMFGSFPTASDEALRASQVSLGPEVMVAQIWSWGVLGLMVNHAWGLSNDEDEDDFNTTTLPDVFWTASNSPLKSNVTAGQYFYVVNLKNAWQITGQPTWAYNHNADEGNRFTFPIGTGINKVTKFGKLPVKLTMQYWYYLASPDTFGPQHQIRIQIAPVIPLPW